MFRVNFTVIYNIIQINTTECIYKMHLDTRSSFAEYYVSMVTATSLITSSE